MLGMVTILLLPLTCPCLSEGSHSFPRFYLQHYYFLHTLGRSGRTLPLYSRRRFPFRGSTPPLASFTILCLLFHPLPFLPHAPPLPYSSCSFESNLVQLAITGIAFNTFCLKSCYLLNHSFRLLSCY